MGKVTKSWISAAASRMMTHLSGRWMDVVHIEPALQIGKVVARKADRMHAELVSCSKRGSSSAWRGGSDADARRG